jgi:hypothetical protein
MKQSAIAVVASVLALGPTAIRAQAQTNQVRTPTPAVAPTNPLASPIWNGIGPPPAAFNPAQGAATNPLAAAANAALLSGQTNPYASAAGAYGANGLSTNGYGTGYGYYETETGGFLRGTADILNNQGKWLVSLQQASLLKEQVRQAMVETRRKQLNQYVSERGQTPTFEQERESAKTQRLIRSLNNPPEGEILSGQALNDILADIAATDQPAARGPAAKIDADLLGHINLTSNRGAANAGLFKNDARLTWPSALLDEGSKADRDLVDSLASTARRQAVDGRVDAGSLRELVAASRRLHQKLAAEVKNLTATQYIEAGRFLSQLDDAIRVLSRPDAGDYITGKNTAVGRDVAELVVSMVAKGLRFAPASPGDEATYLVLHRALVAYDGAKPQVLSDRVSRE